MKSKNKSIFAHLGLAGTQRLLTALVVMVTFFGVAYFTSQLKTSSLKPSYNQAAADTATSNPGVPCSNSNPNLMLYDCQVEYNAGSHAVFYWKTSRPASSQVILKPASGNGIFGLGPIDAMPYTYTTEHRVRIEDTRLVYGSDYKYTLASTTADGSGASSFETAFTMGGPNAPSGATQSFKTLPSTTLVGAVPIDIEISGNWDQITLFVRPKSVSYGAGGLGGQKSWRTVQVINEPGGSGYFKKVTFNWDTRTVPNGDYELIAASKVLPNWGGTSFVYPNIKVNNPITSTCATDSPCIYQGSVVNAAEYTTNYAFGSILSIFGERLSSTTTNASTSPLPTTLGDTQVWFGANGTFVKAPLSFVSPNQLNLQIPYDAIPTSFPYSVIVKVVRGAKESPTLTLSLDQLAPAVFAGQSTSSGVFPAMLHASSTDSKKLTYVSSASTADAVHSGGSMVVNGQTITTKGEIVMMYVTGLGIPRDPVTDPGNWATGTWPLSKVGKPSITIGGITVNDDFNRYAFRAPGLIGIDQINFKVPNNVPEGLQDIKVCGPVKCSKTYKVMVTRTEARYPDAVKMDSYASNNLTVSGPTFSFAPTSPANLFSRSTEEVVPVVESKLSFLKPTAGFTCRIGGSCTLQWKTNPSTTYNLTNGYVIRRVALYSNGSKVLDIAYDGGMDPSKFYYWNIPSTVAPGSYTLKAELFKGKSIFSTSAEPNGQAESPLFNIAR